jgi:hypothetical protein
VAGTDCNAEAGTLTLRVDLAASRRFAVSRVGGEHPVRDTVAKGERHLDFLRHGCIFGACGPRVRLPDGTVRQIERLRAGSRPGFTLLFEATVPRPA